MRHGHASLRCGPVRPAARGRFWTDAARLGTGGCPRAVGAGCLARRRWPWQATAFIVDSGCRGPRGRNDNDAPQMSSAFPLGHSFSNSQRASPRTPRDSKPGRGRVNRLGSGRRLNQKPARPLPWVAGMGRKGGVGAAGPGEPLRGKGGGARPEGSSAEAPRRLRTGGAPPPPRGAYGGELAGRSRFRLTRGPAGRRPGEGQGGRRAVDAAAGVCWGRVER